MDEKRFHSFLSACKPPLLLFHNVNLDKWLMRQLLFDKTGSDDPLGLTGTAKGAQSTFLAVFLNELYSLKE